MTYEQFREINTFLPLIAFGWLAVRTRLSWAAEWAKPDHVWHYRALLVALMAYVLLSSLAAIVHEAMHTQASFVSPLYTAQAVAVITLCWAWPLRAKRRL